MGHKHTFTALTWTFGPYGRQDVHVHSCFTEDCCRVLIGPGRRCDGNPRTHHREWLDDGASAALGDTAAPNTKGEAAEPR